MNRIRRRALCAIVPCLLVRSAAAADTPRIAIEKPTVDFGPVVFGKKLAHTFVVRNPGGAALHVQQVTSPCECFRATFDETIAPGKSGRIRTEIDTSALQGPILLTVRVRTNDPGRPIARVEIKALVKGAIMLVPRDHLDLTTVSGQDQEDAIELEINRKDPLPVTAVESDSVVFSAKLEKLTPGRRYRILVKASGAQAVGMHSGTIRIHTADEDRPVIPLRCTLLVVSSVAVEPDTLFLQNLSQDEARQGPLEGPGEKPSGQIFRGRGGAVRRLVRACPRAHASGRKVLRPFRGAPAERSPAAGTLGGHAAREDQPARRAGREGPGLGGGSLTPEAAGTLQPAAPTSTRYLQLSNLNDASLVLQAKASVTL